MSRNVPDENLTAIQVDGNHESVLVATDEVSLDAGLTQRWEAGTILFQRLRKKTKNLRGRCCERMSDEDDS